MTLTVEGLVAWGADTTALAGVTITGRDAVLAAGPTISLLTYAYIPIRTPNLALTPQAW